MKNYIVKYLWVWCWLILLTGIVLRNRVICGVGVLYILYELWYRIQRKLGAPYRIRAKGLHYEYKEGERRAIIEFEIMNGDLDLVIYSRLLKRWEPSHNHEIITDDERHLILERLSERLRKQKAKFRIE